MRPTMPSVSVPGDRDNIMASHGKLMGCTATRALWRFGFVAGGENAEAFEVDTQGHGNTHVLCTITGLVLGIHQGAKADLPRAFRSVLNSDLSGSPRLWSRITALFSFMPAVWTGILYVAKRTPGFVVGTIRTTKVLWWTGLATLAVGAVYPESREWIRSQFRTAYVKQIERKAEAQNAERERLLKEKERIDAALAESK